VSEGLLSPLRKLAAFPGNWVLGYCGTNMERSHRLSTIISCDEIVVLHEGCVIERGTHSSLLQQRGRYWQLWDKQTKQRPQRETESWSDQQSILQSLGPWGRTVAKYWWTKLIFFSALFHINVFLLGFTLVTHTVVILVTQSLNCVPWLIFSQANRDLLF
jgi:hypothetical protein